MDKNISAKIDQLICRHVERLEEFNQIKSRIRHMYPDLTDAQATAVCEAVTTSAAYFDLFR